MYKQLLFSFRTTVFFFFYFLLYNINAIASPIRNNLDLLAQTQELNYQIDTPSVDRLKDINPDDWAYQALKNLVEKYNCLKGYPLKNYGKNLTLSRYEFAAGLNACISKIENLLPEQSLILGEDITILKRLETDFARELNTLKNRIDLVENRLDFLEENLFSTTTKLRGEVIIAAVAAGGIDTNLDDPKDPVGDRFTLSNRVRLNLETSFTGKDALIIRLQSGNIPELDESFGTDMARLGFDANSNNDLSLRDLQYRFPVNDNIKLWLGGNSFSFRTIANLHNPILDSSGQGSISRFTRRNPAVFRNGSEQQGIGTNIEFNDLLSLDIGYFAGSGEDPSSGNGLFNGDYTAIGQLNFAPTDTFDLGFAFGYSYAKNSVNLSGSIGSPLAQKPFGNVPTSALRFGIQGNWRINKKLNFATWGGYVRGKNKLNNERADIWNWSANLALLDIAKEGDFFAIAGGMPPRATFVDGGKADRDTSYLVELLYAYPVMDNLLITPGAYVLFNPNHNTNNDTIWVSVIRATFRF